MPSKLTAYGLYITIITTLIGAVSYISIKIDDYLSSHFWLEEITITPESIHKAHPNSKIRSVEVRYPKIGYYLSNPAFNKINNEIESSALSYLGDSLIDYSFGFDVGMASHDIISLKMHQYYYYDGAANGNESFFSINVEPSSGKQIDFFDVFDARRGALPEIKELIHDEIIKQCELGVFGEKYTKESFIPRFYVTNKTVEFIFSEYEVTPGACGGITTSIEHAKLNRYIKPSGPLGFILPPSGDWEASNHFLNGVLGDIQRMQRHK